ncbi:hypothetical protein GDO78_020447 [Eleutherodactylus coqui]|uniref:Uncharacterized protein n=1 Tax=Eleutherodactylus coqui TaxID=57060 RepID=A0A8J6EHQ4_ELECQ|nr:hypothetical protein GDO78_020447 [Eleutherodactylus coqui]
MEKRSSQFLCLSTPDLSQRWSCQYGGSMLSPRLPPSSPGQDPHSLDLEVPFWSLSNPPRSLPIRDYFEKYITRRKKSYKAKVEVIKGVGQG